MKRIKTALISVSDKKNLKSLIQNLRKYRIKLISSGGTFKEIKRLKFECLEVSKFTNSKEILGGRVKTLHPKIHGGILAKRTDEEHKKDIEANDLELIDLVVVNLYPLSEIFFLFYLKYQHEFLDGGFLLYPLKFLEN